MVAKLLKENAVAITVAVVALVGGYTLMEYRVGAVEAELDKRAAGVLAQVHMEVRIGVLEAASIRILNNVDTVGVEVQALAVRVAVQDQRLRNLEGRVNE
jgi:hypothetical protein